MDFTLLQHISPLGITSLLSTLEFLDEKYFLDVRVNDHGVIGYMERMDFFKYCPEDVKSGFDERIDMDYYYSRNRWDKKKNLLEVRQASIEEEIDEINTSVKEILRSKKLQPNRISDIQSFITELGNNVIDHADANCFVSVQYYKSNETVQISIADSGIGIFESIKDYIDDSESHKVIERAIFTKASSKVDEERGKGLIEVRARAFQWSRDAQLYLRTNDSKYQITEKKLKLLEEGNKSFGTFYHIVINV
ncbi:ATP-binding protein [Bacillus wiedmannii]|uniref:ATP-binding protein n=1 Tax=Bacillus wiedmannii TaxID=1890302 RepID=UPI0015D50F70|nr:ATP-binding protein [Bacillus wiedmannii]